MKPNFALSLSFEGIRLLHRSGRNWQLVGDVPLDSPDLAGALSVLRSTANALDNTGLRCKLVLPNDQIKYLSLNHAVAGKTGVRTALEGATPYPVDDLAYDWVVHEGVTQIAAVARETLDEAEQFATDHRFNPVSFVAIPEDGAYAGEPFFGVTKASAQLLDEGDEVERDSVPPPLDLDPPAAPEPVVAPEEPTPEVTDEPPAEEDTPGDAPDDMREDVGTSEPDAAQAAPEMDDGVDDTEDATASEDADPAPAPSFASIRATRAGKTEAPAAPKLDGASRSGDRATAPDIPVPGPKSSTAKRRSRLSFGLKRTPVADDAVSAPEITGTAAASSEDDAPAANPKRKLLPLPKKRMARPDFADKPIPQAVETKVGGKPRYLGLILTVILLVFLVGVAAWAAVFVEDGLSRLWRGPQKIDAPAVAEIVTPEEETTDGAVDSGGVEFAKLEPAPEVSVPVTPVLPDPTPEPVAQLPRVLTPGEASARYAVTGIWLKAPAQPEVTPPETLDDLYVVSIDRKVPELDAVALPGPGTALTDRPLSLLTSPPAPDVTFALGDDGLVVPTPEGAMTPDGYTVFLGKPPRVPPATPERSAPVPETDADQALAGYRPKLRPERLVENNERIDLGGRTREELAGLRPKLRPERAEPAVVAVAKPAETPEQAEATEQSATIAFVKPKKKPKLRPKDLAARATAPQPTKIASASAAATVQPRIPTSTSVTRAATVQNAINLRKVNLIGVYGKPDSRRALVRLKNGRYKKVKVGDRMDGGRVASISSDKLSYKKGGRSIVLKLP